MRERTMGMAVISGSSGSPVEVWWTLAGPRLRLIPGHRSMWSGFAFVRLGREVLNFVLFWIPGGLRFKSCLLS